MGLNSPTQLPYRSILNLNLTEIQGSLDSGYYCNVVQQGLIAEAKARLGDIWNLMHDKISVYTSNYMLSWLEANEVNLLEWAAKSPELNIIENVWGLLAQMIHAYGRQFDNVEELTDAVHSCWLRVTATYIRGLYESILRRLFSVIKQKRRIG